MNLHLKIPSGMPPRQAVEAAGLPHPHADTAAGPGARPRGRVSKPGSSSLEFSQHVLVDHMRRDALPTRLAGIPDDGVIRRTLLETATEFEGHPRTVNQFIGRYWERILHQVPDVQRRLGQHLTTALQMQDYFLRRIHGAETGFDDLNQRAYGGTGFFSANGDDVFLADQERRQLIERTRTIGVLDSTHPEVLARTGIEYADRFSINGSDYVDGAFLMQTGERIIVLLRVEAKTIGSQGVEGQLGSFFVRLAASGRDEPIECHLPGRDKVVPLDRSQLLFNPTWTDAGVGVQAWWKNEDVWADARRPDAPALSLPGTGKRGKTLEDRLASSATRTPDITSPTGFLTGPAAVPGDSGGLAALAVSGPIIYAKADLRPLRSWLERLAQASPRR